MNQRTHILMVEPEESVARFIEGTLGEHDIGTTRVATAEGARQELKKPGREFDAILLDRQLPDEDGIELLRSIKDHAHFRHIPVVVATAVNDPTSVQQGLAAGAYYYLTKPLEAGLLASVVNLAIARNREYLSLQASVREGARAWSCLQSCVFEFRTLADAREIAQGIARGCPEPERAVIGLQELMINAVEHGNLGVGYAMKGQLLRQGRWLAEIERRYALPQFRDRTVTVTLERSPEYIAIGIIDQGAGFDWKPYLEFDPKRALDAHGRGIAMARLMSFDALEFLGNGNTVSARVDIRHVGEPIRVPGV